MITYMEEDMGAFDIHCSNVTQGASGSDVAAWRAGGPGLRGHMTGGDDDDSLTSPTIVSTWPCTFASACASASTLASRWVRRVLLYMVSFHHSTPPLHDAPPIYTHHLHARTCTVVRRRPLITIKTATTCLR
jgi:hypothetical protein